VTVHPVDAGRGTRFSVAERASLAVEIVGAYARARWLLRGRDFPAVLAAIRVFPPDTQEERAHVVRSGERRAGIRLGRVVGRALGALPFDSRCLIRSLVLTRLLARRGIASVFVIGVRSAPDFAAHAWVELDGLPLLPPGGDNFERLVQL
jgi:hypothetical protein